MDERIHEVQRGRRLLAPALLSSLLAGCSTDPSTGEPGTDGGGGGAGGAMASTGGAGPGGASNGGSASGGASNGGSANGGSANGGASNGGSASGGSNPSAGGQVNTGGAPGVGGSAGAPGTGGASSDIPGGGTLLFQEPFDDTAFGSRGWYDGPAGATSPNAVAGTAFECHFASGATTCTAGKPARHKLTDTETAYVSFHLRFSSNWVGSGRAYHPHMFHFLTNADPDYIGPASTHLTTYMEVVQGRALLGLQDSLNVDDTCILRNNDTFVGCNGDFGTYAFTENRSVCSCNGLLGDVDGRDCFDNGGYWYSARTWQSPGEAFGTVAPFQKDVWHFVEIYFAMNSIQNGVGVPDGKIRWVQDGQTLVRSDAVLMRTGANATLAFNQLAMLPYIGDGSPVDQSYWVDEMTVATARP